MRYLCCLVLSLWSFVPAVQATEAPKAIPNTVRVLVRTEAIAKLRPLFANKRTANVDIQQLSLSDEENIAGLLGFSSLHIIRFAPFAAQHSAMFEDVRERINPHLFRNLDVAATSDDLLRTSEDKLSRWFTLEYSDSIAPERVVFMSKVSDLIELAEPVYPRYTQSTPLPPAMLNDPLLDSQYYLKMTHALQAWNIQQCDSTMVVASIDQGIEFNHPDLGGAVWHNYAEMGDDGHGGDKSTNKIDDDGDGFVDDWTGWDFSGATGDSQRNSPTSESMHGHHVAGILAAIGNNGIGIAGVAHGAKLMVLKAQSNFSCTDRINTGYEGIIYAADHGAKVISCSWGGPGRSTSEQDVIDYAYAKNTIVVCSAGNDGHVPYANFPSSYEHTVSIGSVEPNDTITVTSNPSPRVTVCAPGSSILSTLYPDSIGLCYPAWIHLCGEEPKYDTAGYGKMCGTSMAAPQAAGALALVWQHFPTLKNYEVFERLRATCDKISGDPLPGFNGRGLINDSLALAELHPHSVRIAQSSVQSQYGNSWLYSPDSATVQITVHSMLDIVPQLHIDLDVITPDGQPSSLFTVSPKTIDLPSFPGGGLYSLPTVSLQSENLMTVPTDLLLRLKMSDTSVGYRADYDYVPFHVNLAYRTLHNNLTLSIGDNGSIGFRDAIRDEAGDGLRWEKPAKPLRPNAKSVLLAGGLIVARDTDHVVDPFGAFDFFGQQASLSAVAPMQYDSGEQNVRFYLGPGSHTAGLISDDGIDSALRAHIRANVNAFTFDSLAPNAAIVSYTFTRPYVPNFNAALAMDWDFADYGNRDTAWFEASDSILFAGRYKEAGYPVAAMKLISAIPDGSSMACYIMSSNGLDPGYGPDALGNKPAKCHALEQNKLSGLHGDVAVLLGVRNVQAAANSNALNYIIALGESTAMARYNLQCALAAINGETLPKPPDEAVTSKVISAIQVWPNPTNSIVHIIGELPMSVVVSDMLGREVLRTSGDIDLSQLAPGVYDIEVTSNGQTIHRRVVRE